MQKQVVLVDESNRVIGKASKDAVHNAATPLHRGFSLFLFDSRGDLLIQQRSNKKKTWPLVWSNSCCGHPRPEESSVEAAKRRLKFELGIDEAIIYEVLPQYRYRAERDGIVENEICPILVAFSDESPRINREEVAAIRWLGWSEFVRQATATPEAYSIWSVEETLLLDQSELFRALYAKHVQS